MTTWRARYNAVIRSKRWKLLKQARRNLTNNRCERCGRADYLELHHLHYQTLGNESLEDVELLCESCHEAADEEREIRVQHEQEARQASYELKRIRARFQGWLKRIGLDINTTSQDVLQKEWDKFIAYIEDQDG